METNGRRRCAAPHVTTKLEEINSKYFNRRIDVTVTFAPEGHAFIKTHISLRVGKDIMVTAQSIEPEAYVSFDVTAEKIAKQLRRYKRRLRDHHERMDQTPESEMTKARDYVLAIQELSGKIEEEPEDDGIPQGDDPVIVAEQPMQIQK